MGVARDLWKTASGNVDTLEVDRAEAAISRAGCLGLRTSVAGMRSQFSLVALDAFGSRVRVGNSRWCIG